MTIDDQQRYIRNSFAIVVLASQMMIIDTVLSAMNVPYSMGLSVLAVLLIKPFLPKKYF